MKDKQDYQSKYSAVSNAKVTSSKTTTNTKQSNSTRTTTVKTSSTVVNKKSTVQTTSNVKSSKNLRSSSSAQQEIVVVSTSQQQHHQLENINQEHYSVVKQQQIREQHFEYQQQESVSQQDDQQQLEDDDQLEFMQLEQQISNDQQNSEQNSQQQEVIQENSIQEENSQQNQETFENDGQILQQQYVLSDNNQHQIETEIIEEQKSQNLNQSLRSNQIGGVGESNGTSDTEDLGNVMLSKQKSEMGAGDRTGNNRKRKLSRVDEEIKQTLENNNHRSEDMIQVAYQSKYRDAQSDTFIPLDQSETSSRKDIKKSKAGAVTHKEKPKSINNQANHHKKRRTENGESKANSKSNINQKKRNNDERSQQLDESQASKAQQKAQKSQMLQDPFQNLTPQQQAQMVQMQQQNPWMQMMQLQMGMYPQSNMMNQYGPYGMNGMMQMSMPYQQRFMPGAPQMGFGGMQYPQYMGYQPQYINQGNSNPLMNQQPQPQYSTPQQLDTQQLDQMIQAMKQMKELGQLPQNLQDTLEQYEGIKAQIQEIQNENQMLENELQKPSEDMLNQSYILGELPLQQKIQIRRDEMLQQRRNSEMRNPSQIGMNVINNNEVILGKQESEKNEEQKQESQKEQEDYQVVEVMVEVQNSVTEGTIKENPTDMPQPMGTVMSEQRFQQQQQLQSSHRQSLINNNPPEEINEQDLVLKEIAYLASKGHDPTPELEKENEELAFELETAKKRERDLLQSVNALQYENDILFGKSNSMDHSVQNYGKRLEELSKQIDELNAILRIKDSEMIEMTNEIHNLRMMKEAMRKEIIFRKQREDQLESNIRKLQVQVDRAQFESDDIRVQLNEETQSNNEFKEQNKYIKQQIERFRTEIQEDQEKNDQIKHQINNIQARQNDYESKQFSYKNQVDRLKNENDQIMVDLSYAKATTDNQRDAYQKLNDYYQKQVMINQDLDQQREGLMLNKNHQQSETQFKQIQSKTSRHSTAIQFQESSLPMPKQTGRFSIAQKKLESIMERQNSSQPFEQAQASGQLNQYLYQQDTDRRVSFNVEDMKRSSSQGKGNMITQSRNFQADNSFKNNSFSKYQDINALNSSRIKTILFDLGEQKEDLNSSITGQKTRGGVLSQTREFQNRNFLQQMPNILEWQDKTQRGVSSGYNQLGMDQPYREYAGGVSKADQSGLNNSFNNGTANGKTRLQLQAKSESMLKKNVDSYKRGGPPAISVTIDPYDPSQKYTYAAGGQRSERYTAGNSSAMNSNNNINQSFNLQQQGEDMHNASVNYGLNNSMQINTKGTGRMKVGDQSLKQSDPIQTVKRDTQKINQLRDELNVCSTRRERINGEINKISDKNRDGKQKRNNLESEMKQLNKKIGDIKLQLKKMDALKPIL
ncbi:UNKNOWN [Stylonychia lemnae]|uniref:Uncharacterized protein n=1 Tax=Stylonychia lemnae TaxID=5949 RepID=A0A078ADM2_STYLE|nr:UNKNOWN [Stylonychia lemnae]|eukprot:CDW79632.1 UNKNOWN [Stylonychia lemnae]